MIRFRMLSGVTIFLQLFNGYAHTSVPVASMLISEPGVPTKSLNVRRRRPRACARERLLDVLGLWLFFVCFWYFFVLFWFIHWCYLAVLCHFGNYLCVHVRLFFVKCLVEDKHFRFVPEGIDGQLTSRSS